MGQDGDKCGESNVESFFKKNKLSETLERQVRFFFECYSLCCVWNPPVVQSFVSLLPCDCFRLGSFLCFVVWFLHLSFPNSIRILRERIVLGILISSKNTDVIRISLHLYQFERKIDP